MSLELKDKIQKKFQKRDISPKSLLQTIKNSINGIKCYASDGKSIIIYIFFFIIEILLSFIFKISGLEWILIICILGIILAVELINTAIEAACDAVTKSYDPFVKISKDCGSAATFIIFIVGVILNIIIFLPKILILF